MANIDRPNGAVAVDTITGAPVTAKLNAYNVDVANATAIFPGDWVKLEADGNVAPAAVGDILIGVCAGVEVAPPTKEDGFLSNNNIGVSELPGYLPALTAGVILVTDDPDQLYEIQSDGTITIDDTGDNAEIVAGAGSTTTGRSAHEVSSTTIVGAAQLRLIRPVKRADNDVTLANGRWVVMINEHSYRTAAGA